MRSQLLFVGLIAGGAAGLGSMIACSSSETHVIEIPTEGGATNGDGSLTNNPDGGEPIYDLPSTALVKGQYALLAVIADQAIIRDFPATTGGNVNISAVPINGGAPTKLFELNPNTDGIAATFGALAHWSNVTNGIGTLDVWTPATGLKTGVAEKSVSGNLFASSDDGSRIAFSQDATLSGTALSTASLAVRDTAGATNLVTLSGAVQGVNLLAGTKGCGPQLEFETDSKAFFAMYCTGTEGAATAARIYSVPGTAAPTATRIDDTTGDANANTVDASHGFSTDVAGDKIAWVDTSKKLKAVSVATPATVDVLDTGAADIAMLGDGSAVVYAIPQLLGDGGVGSLVMKKATIAATPVLSTIATLPGLAYLDGSKDGMKLVFATQQDSSAGTTDIHLVDFTQPSPAVVDLLAGATGAEVGFTGDDKTVVWADITTPIMRSLTLGGQPKDLVSGNGGLLSDTGTDLVVFSNPTTPSGTTTTFFDVGLTDAVGGGALKTIAIGNPAPQAIIRGKKLVYEKALDIDTGVFAIDLP